jgi:hypothetical protein
VVLLLSTEATWSEKAFDSVTKGYMEPLEGFGLSEAAACLPMMTEGGKWDDVSLGEIKELLEEAY